MTVEFRLLGPLEVVVSGRPVVVGHARQQCVLAILLLEANHVVSVDRLLDRIWGDRPPQRARGTLHSYLSRLRKQLAPAAGVSIVRRSDGYLLALDADTLDLTRFRQLVRAATDADADDARIALLTQALSLWRGEPLGSLDADWLHHVRRELAAEGLTASLDRHDALLRSGRHQELLGPLSTAAEEHPWDERIVGQLMLALYRNGRQTEALEVFERLRRRLADEVGADPSPPLRDLHQRILRADPQLSAPPRSAGSDAAPPIASAPSAPSPRQLPDVPRSFVGRVAEFGQIDTALKAAADDATASIAVISGGAGMGKTWLALRWAADNLDLFPDGQLYADLHGFDPTREPADPATILRGFLEALDVEPARIPTEPSAREGLFRSLTANRRTLVTLDNARDSDTVLPLLPGAGGSRVLITSRRRFTGLSVTHGARAVNLQPLPDDDARNLVLRRLGRDLRSGERPALEELLRICAGLPLALAILAARAAARAEVPLAVVLADFQDAAATLDVFDGGELAVDLRAVLATSCSSLTPAAAFAFGLLGLVPGPDLALPAVASLVAMDLDEAHSVLDELVTANLLQKSSNGRFSMHDLVRLYARENVESDEAPLTRLLDHTLHTAHAAALLLSPQREPLALAGPARGVILADLPDLDAAMGWFTAEHQALLAAIGHAGAHGYDVHAYQLAWTLATYCGRRGYWQDWALAQHVAVAAAERLGDTLALAEARRLLANAYSTGHQYEQAHTQLVLASDAFAQIGEHRGQAIVHFDLALLFDREKRPAEALPHAERALHHYRAAGYALGEAVALNALGWYHCELGDYRLGIEACEQALHRAREIASVYCESNALDSLGYAHHHLGEYAEAISHYRQAIELLRDMGDRASGAISLDHLGDSYRAAGDVLKAHLSWREALETFQESGAPEAEQVRQKLAGHDS